VDFLSERTLRLLKDQGSSIVDLVGNKEVAEGEALPILMVQERLAKATGVVVPPDELRALLKSGASNDSTANIDSRCADTRNTFYPYTSTLRAVGVARRIGESQGVVWATGTHTTTPVTIAATGPTSENFRGWMNTEHVGQRLLEALTSR
jgi:alkaline phosphatase